MKATSQFTVKQWDENPYHEIPNTPRLTKASIIFALQGELSGDALVEYLMYYQSYDATDPHKGVARYVGHIRFDGTIQGKRGTVVLEDQGKYENGIAHSQLTILDGSGTGELQGISGHGEYAATKSEHHFTLEYTL